jgi:hypothetical protein
MTRFVDVTHREWIEAPLAVVRAQFADLQHHIACRVHPKLAFEILAQQPGHARYVQRVRLLGIVQRDVFERSFPAPNEMLDRSVEGFNRGATLAFRFEPAVEAGRSGTAVTIAIRLPAPPLLGWLAPLLRRQVRAEVAQAAREDKCDIEAGYRPASDPGAQASLAAV